MPQCIQCEKDGLIQDDDTVDPETGLCISCYDWIYGGVVYPDEEEEECQ